jgi:Mn-containing catalase
MRQHEATKRPWHEGEDLQLVEAPAFQALSRTCEAGPGEPALDDRTTSTAGEPEMIEELLVQQLRDLLHAEGQLVKALPKMRETTHPVIALLLAPDRLVDIGHVHAPCT